MKKSLRTLLLIMTLVVTMLGSSLTVFADTETGTTDSNTKIKNYLTANAPNGSDRSTWGNARIGSYFKKSTDVPTGTSGYNSHLVGTITWMWKTEDNDSIVAAIDRLEADQEAVDNLTNITDGLNIQADTGTAVTMLQGVTPYISGLLGFMVILISIGMTIFSALDIVYIVFPPFRGKCEEAKQSGSGVLAKQDKNTGETKLRFVSDEAQYAVIAAETTQTGKNALTIYFGKRLVSYIVLAIVLFIILTGNITVFTDIAIKAVSGVLEIIQQVSL